MNVAEHLAQKAWLKYRDDYMRRRVLNPRQASSQLRRREFIAGYLAAIEEHAR